MSKARPGFRPNCYAQLHTFKTVPHTGLAVIIDIGEADDIHPKNKQDVGGRMAKRITPPHEPPGPK